MMRGTVKGILLAVVISTGASAQSYLGGVRGLVSDPAKASIANAKVTLTNQGTNVARSGLSNNAGEFVFSQVDPGTYTLSAESPGFRKSELHGVVIGTQEFLTIDLKLEVGAVTESVQVTEEIPPLESSNASQGQVLDNQKLSDLPNLGRNPFMLSKIVPNVIPVGNPAYNRMEDQSGSSSISIAGGPVRGNNYLIDGVPITDSTNRAIIIPALESVQEVKIQANTYDAEMARTGGGMFNTLMRSGANAYHGSLYGHIRRTSMDANSFFNNAAGSTNGVPNSPITDQPNTTWGASFGGRVFIPKVYDGRNKTFFYLGVEHYDDTQSSSSVFNTPTALEKSGDFSKSGVTIYDPLNTVGGVRQPFPGNVIPTSRINPVGLAIANNFQAPTSAPSSYGAPDLNAPGRLPCRAAQFTAKFDEDFFTWWRASLSYLRYFSLEPGNTEFPTVSSPDQWRLLRRVDTTQLNNTFSINPTTVLTVRYGFNRFPNYSYDVSQGYNISALGFPSSLVSQINPSLSQFPDIQMSSLYNLSVSDNNSFYVLASDNFSTSASKYMGKHSLKFGFDYRRIKAAGNDANDAAGQYSFNGVFTKSTPTAGGVGVDLADMLLGYPSSGNIYTSSKLTDIANYYGLYIQDDFRVTNKLTINVGMRWEHEPGVYEQNNGMIVNFDGTAANPLASKVTGISPKGEVVYAGSGKTNVGNPYGSKWGPRFGVAYQLAPKTVIRAGYGVFFAPQFALGSPIATVGFNQTTAYNASTDSNATPAGSLSNPFPGGILQPVGKTLGTSTGIGQSFSLVDPNARSPYVQQFSFDIQRELPFGIASEIGYVGSRSKHLTLGAASINENALDPSLLSASNAASLRAGVPNPFYGLIATGSLSGATVPAAQLLLPYPTYGTISKLFTDNNKAKYDSLVLKASKTYKNGITFFSGFTWSRNWDESSGGVGNTLNSGSKAPQNPYNMASEYSFSNVDSPFRWSTSVSYELPVGKGKALLGNGGPASYILGGWVINTVSIFQTGFPLQISQSTNNNSTFGYASQRPNATGTSPATSGSLEDRLGNYINGAAFSTAAAGTFGNLSRTIDMRGPGQVNWDMSVFKNFSVKEKLKAQFRAEALNAMNTPLFYGPNVSFGSSSFGKITTQANFSRQLQLALRFSF
jgi:hypothetical protein